MTLRHAFILALPVLIAAGGLAGAQSPWPAPNGGGGAAPTPWPAPNGGGGAAPSPWPAPGASGAPPTQGGFSPQQGGFSPQQPQEPPCMKDFMPLRLDAEKKAQAIHAASKRKATPKEACVLFNAFVTAESKVLKFAQANAASCGIPSEALTEMKKGHAQAAQIRAKVCQAAAQMGKGPAAPTLGDALGAPLVPNASNVKSGRGTFDTLTGTPLGSK